MSKAKVVKKTVKAGKKAATKKASQSKKKGKLHTIRGLTPLSRPFLNPICGILYTHSVGASKTTKKIVRSKTASASKSKKKEETKATKVKPFKDPNAPKKPMSAFFYFQADRRSGLKEENPDLTNKEIVSSKL